MTNLTMLLSPLDFLMGWESRTQNGDRLTITNVTRYMTFDYCYCCFEHKGITFVNSNN